MIAISKQNGVKSYGLKEYVVDTPEDIRNLPVSNPMGSTAYVISTGETYILNG